MICRTSKTNSVSLYLAVLRIGAIYVPLNPQYTATETEHFLVVHFFKLNIVDLSNFFIIC